MSLILSAFSTTLLRINSASRLTASTLRFEGLLALREGRRNDARRCFRQALRIDRWHVKTYLRLIRTYLPAALIRATTGRTKAPS